MKRLLKYSLVFALAFSSLSFQQPQPSGFDTNAKIKAVFIYNFTKYFEWPKNMQTGNFIIDVIGGTNKGIHQELNKLAISKQVLNQKIEIKSSTSIEANIKPHIVFLLNDASDLLKELAARYKGNGTLIITEKTGLAKLGSAINFVVVDNKQKFEYNEKNAEKVGLKTSDQLKSLAIAVE